MHDFSNSQMLGEVPDAIGDKYTSIIAAAERARIKFNLFTVLVIGSTLWWAYQRDKKRGLY